jgi:hypothetical protein
MQNNRYGQNNFFQEIQLAYVHVSLMYQDILILDCALTFSYLKCFTVVYILLFLIGKKCAFITAVNENNFL